LFNKKHFKSDGKIAIITGVNQGKNNI
jgi:hypothetical protein